MVRRLNEMDCASNLHAAWVASALAAVTQVFFRMLDVSPIWERAASR